jgi:hypothetical protein
MARKWLPIFFILTGMAFFLLPWAMPAHAQEPTPENDANCIACHTHQYYLYDSGKWFCLCDAPMHCVYCHGGRTDSYAEEVAHEDLVLYPTRDQAERCQTCHEEDYLSRVVTFSSVAGISSTPRNLITATPAKLAALPAAAQPAPALLHLSQLEPWRVIGLGGVGIAMILILIIGYRCWKADCLVKSQS